MKRFIRTTLAMSLMLSASAAFAQETLIEGFEDNTDPFAWADSSSPVPQTNNAAAPRPGAAAPEFVDGASTPAGNVTQGLLAGRFVNGWNPVPAEPKPANPSYLPGTTDTFWSFRWNAAQGAAAARPSIPHSSTLKVDVFNNGPDTYQFSITLSAPDGLKNLPFQPIAPGANTISWDLSTLSSPGSVLVFTGTDSFLDTSASSKIRGFFSYTETAPTANFSADLDNIRVETAQTDFVAPAAPTLLSLEQGTNPGDLIVKWAANTEVDLDGYRIFLGTDAQFGTPITNRISLSSTPAATANAAATQTTLTGVPTGVPVYVRLAAIDNATPSVNQSLLSFTLSAILNADGSAPSDLVVLDYDRFVPGDTGFPQNGYEHGAVYWAHALADKGRSFVSANSVAVESGALSLTPDPLKLVYWSSALDGETVVGQAINAAAQAALTTYVNADGKLLITGTAIGEDLVTNATGPTFFSDVLSATLVAPSATNSLTNASGLFPTLPGTFATGADVFNVAGFTTADNEVYTALGTAEEALGYDPAAGGAAAILNNNTTVLLGFGFESVRDVTTNPTTNFAAARLVRAQLLSDIVEYLLNIPPLEADNFYLYE